ncbi:MAG: MurR/RpiR family transcriptional regulator [Armatimonadota bacterium]
MPTKQTVDISVMRTLGALARVSSVAPSLNRQQRTVAEFVVDQPELVKGLAIGELATQCGVGQATILRFCRAIGFEGYTEFKLALAEELGQSTKAVPMEHKDVSPNDTPEELIRKVLSHDIQVIANTLTTLDPQQLVQAIQVLMAARTVVAFGSGGSLAVGMDMYYRLLRSGIRCLMSVDSHIQAVDAGLLEPGDVGIAISYSGETRDVIDCAKLAKQAGATIVCITNHPRSTLARLCDICLSASSTKTRWTDDAIAARLGQLAVIDALCVGICVQNQHVIAPILERIKRSSATKRLRK